jgi:hypothetical protein
VAKLTPPDYDRCQGESKNNNPFTMGGVIGRWVRCNQKPTTLLEEMSPGEDGKMGSMTLCDDCLAIFKKMFPGTKVKFTEIKKIKKGKKKCKQ